MFGVQAISSSWAVGLIWFSGCTLQMSCLVSSLFTQDTGQPLFGLLTVCTFCFLGVSFLACPFILYICLFALWSVRSEHFLFGFLWPLWKIKPNEAHFQQKCLKIVSFVNYSRFFWTEIFISTTIKLKQKSCTLNGFPHCRLSWP